MNYIKFNNIIIILIINKFERCGPKKSRKVAGSSAQPTPALHHPRARGLPLPPLHGNHFSNV
jgi:hypothetical protein